MVAPSDSFPFYEVFSKYFPDFPESQDFPEDFTTPEEAFQRARENLEQCFDECELNSVVKFCKSLPPLTYAQLEAIDKARCNLFRQKDYQLQDLKQEVKNLAVMPWHEKYKWSWPFVASGALIGIFWLCMSPSTARSLTGKASLSSFLLGASTGSLIYLKGFFKETSLETTRLKFIIESELNRFIVTLIDLNQQDKLRTLEVSILSETTQTISKTSARQSISQAENSKLTEKREEIDDSAGPSRYVPVNSENLSLSPQNNETKVEGKFSEIEYLKRKIAEMERQAQIDKKENEYLKSQARINKDEKERFKNQALIEKEQKEHFKNEAQIEKDEKQQVFKGLENHGIFVKVSRRNTP